MSGKDYELIATILKSYRGEIPDKKLDAMAYTFAASLTNTNERFQAGRFINATKNGK